MKAAVMREFGCATGKIIYRSHQAAYRCPNCSFWHLTCHQKRGKPDGVDHREKGRREAAITIFNSRKDQIGGKAKGK